MTRLIGYQWHLRQLMAAKGMFATSDLQPLLAERGIQLSTAQVYRLVAQTPERLSLRTLAALCDILDCTPADLIEPVVQIRAARNAAEGTATPSTFVSGAAAPVSGAVPRPRRARILPP